MKKEDIEVKTFEARIEELKVLELFGGIGACTKALERLHIPHKIVDYVEIDKYAVKSYNAIHGTNFEPQDITEWDKDINVDLIMHGSPCQDFSIAGKLAGGDKGSGTRSSLMYETLRIVEKLKPKYVIWENVKNLLGERNRHNFDNYLKEMERLGYKNYYQVLNAKDYGIPQNRERVFTVSILGDKKFEFPEKKPLMKKLADMLEPEVDERFYLKKTQNIVFTEKRVYWDNSGKGYGSQQDRAVYSDGLSPTLSSCNGNGDKALVCIIASRGRGENNEQHLEPRKDGLTNTITSVQKDNYVAKDYKLRKLTPKECWRLMGFDDTDFEKAEKVNSNAQLYKQAGNSIVVNVLETILKELIQQIKSKYGGKE